MNKEEMSDDFKDVDKGSKNKNYIIVGILYAVIIVLIILLIFELNNKKDNIKDNNNLESLNYN